MIIPKDTLSSMRLQEMFFPVDGSGCAKEKYAAILQHFL